MKNLIKRVARSFGAELVHYLPSNSSGAQLAKVFQLCEVNLLHDIGANQGQFIKGIRDHGYNGKIVSFEPLSSAREKLLPIASSDPARLGVGLTTLQRRRRQFVCDGHGLGRRKGSHRARVFEQARQRHPRRWSRNTRCWRQPEAVWINPPPENSVTAVTLLMAA